MNNQRSLFGSLFRFFNYIFFGMALFVGSIMVLFMLFVSMVGAGISEKAATADIKSDGLRYEEGNKESKNALLSIPVQGVILGSRNTEREDPFGFMETGVTFGYEVQQELKEAAENPQVKGVFLEFNTPGGTIYGSQAIFDGIKYYREIAKKPVVVHIQGMSASGGVWSMVGADAIYSDYGSMIGSIGILGPMFQYFDKPMGIDGGLLMGGIETEGGIETHVISAGRSKDLGNPFRRPTEEELEILQEGVNAEYENFVKHVAAARKIEPEFIKTRLGAMIFDNGKAEEYKLIDGTRNRSAAITELARKAGVEADYKLVVKGSAKDDFLALLSSKFGMQPSASQLQQLLRSQKCSLASHAAIAYFGNPLELCK